MPLFLSEVVWQKKILDVKLEEIKNLLQTEQNDTLVQEFFALLEQRQSRVFSIDAANNASTISIGGTDVSISVAVNIRDTIKEKIDVMTGIIDNPECRLDKLVLQQQRDKFYEEYVLLSMGISRNDLQVTVS